AAKLGKEARMAFNAACVVAQVGGQIDPTKKGVVGKPATEARAERSAYLDRAVMLLALALQRTPDDERPTFWREVVEAELSLRPLSGRKGYGELERLYGGGTR